MRHRRYSVSLLAVIAFASSATLVTKSALALEPGVHVNPNSPAGIEYSFPLGSARSGLSGERASSSATSANSAPLFGIGVNPPRAVALGSRARTTRTTAAAGRRAGAQARALETMVHGGSLGDLVLLVAVVLLAGVLGGTLGLVLRRQPAGS